MSVIWPNRRRDRNPEAFMITLSVKSPQPPFLNPLNLDVDEVLCLAMRQRPHSW